MAISSENLTRLAETRLHEARVLLNNHCFEGAYYLAGYAVECAIKSVIARSFREAEIPDRAWVQAIHTHNLRQFLKHAYPEGGLVLACEHDSALEAHWAAACLWGEQERYKMMTEDGEVSGQSRAEALIRAVGDPEHGVLRWLTTRLP